jgi:hypothetical protein
VPGSHINYVKFKDTDFDKLYGGACQDRLQAEIEFTVVMAAVRIRESEIGE